MNYKVKEVSALTGISVRMLHYYDKIGLLQPENVSPTGYRLYTTNDIEKLSQILFYRELDFTLEETKEIINSSNVNKLEILKMQQKVLAKKRDKIDALMSAINSSITSLEIGDNIENNSIFTSFDLAQISRNKDQLKKDLMLHLFPFSDEECGVKTSEYSKEDWTIVMSKIEEILNEMANKMEIEADHIEVQDLVEQLKEHINNNLIKCNNDTMKLLGDLYVSNSMYRDYAKKYGKTFPEFLKRAIDIYIEKNN
jgi:DNA-binding transcriptional MerR regulator